MGTDRSLVGAKKPAFQERGDPMDAWEVLVGMPRGARHRCTKVPIGEPERFEELESTGVARPAVGDKGGPWLNVLGNELRQAQGRCVVAAGHANTTDRGRCGALSCHEDSG